MLVHPRIAALRGNETAQRRCISRMAQAKQDWLSGAQARAVMADLHAFSAGAALENLTVLSGVTSDRRDARDFVGGLVRRIGQVLREEPLAITPFRFSASEGFARMELLQAGRAVLSLRTYEPLPPASEPTSAQFTDSEVHELVLAGSAKGWIYERCGAAENGIDAIEKSWTAGDSLALRPGIDSRNIVEVTQSLLVLQLTRAPERPAPTRTFRLADGALVFQASGDKRASEDVMALAVLGALGNRSAVPAMRTVALEGSRDPEVRWEALRQVLAMDGAEGFALLEALQKGGPLAQPAEALLGRLREGNPQLRLTVTEAG